MTYETSEPRVSNVRYVMDDTLWWACRIPGYGRRGLQDLRHRRHRARLGAFTEFERVWISEAESVSLWAVEPSVPGKPEPSSGLEPP